MTDWHAFTSRRLEEDEKAARRAVADADFRKAVLTSKVLDDQGATPGLVDEYDEAVTAAKDARKAHETARLKSINYDARHRMGES